MKITGFNSNAECCKRRYYLCMGYRVEFDHDTYIVEIFGVQTGRTPSHLGTIRMQRDEWSAFHSQVYEKWENLDYPVSNDELADGDEV